MATDNLVLFVTAAMILISIYIHYTNKNQEVTYVKSDIDGRKYLVRNLPDKQEAANIIAKIRARLTKLCGILKEKYPTHPVAKRLSERFNPDSLTESTSDSQYTSYSINKGEKIVLCLRSKDDKNELIDANTLLFVAVHECAHLSTDEIGHTRKFWDNFRFLLHQAVSHGLYQKQDFKNMPKKYCGIEINGSPLDDD